MRVLARTVPPQAPNVGADPHVAHWGADAHRRFLLNCSRFQRRLEVLSTTAAGSRSARVKGVPCGSWLLPRTGEMRASS